MKEYEQVCYFNMLIHFKLVGLILYSGNTGIGIIILEMLNLQATSFILSVFYLHPLRKFNIYISTIFLLSDNNIAIFISFFFFFTFRKPNASCVLDSPHFTPHYETLTHELPGQIYNASEQCRQIYGTSFCLVIFLRFIQYT